MPGCGRGHEKVCRGTHRGWYRGTRVLRQVHQGKCPSYCCSLERCLHSSPRYRACLEGEDFSCASKPSASNTRQSLLKELLHVTGQPDFLSQWPVLLLLSESPRKRCFSLQIFDETDILCATEICTHIKTNLRSFVLRWLLLNLQQRKIYLKLQANLPQEAVPGALVQEQDEQEPQQGDLQVSSSSTKSSCRFQPVTSS